MNLEGYILVLSLLCPYQSHESSGIDEIFDS